jgi:hypothetical protein
VRRRRPTRVPCGDTLTGLVGTQTLDASAGTANFSDPNAGVDKTVTITGITLTNGTHGGLASNYVMSPTASATGTIDPKMLTVNAIVENKVYDGTTTATLESYGLSGFVGDQTVVGVNTGGASFTNATVGNDKSVTITGITLANGTNGGLATNYGVSPNATSDATNLTVVTSAFVLTGAEAVDYTLVQPTGLTASITPRSLTVSATGINKVYNGTTAATVDLTDNPIAGDVLTITSTDSFLDKNVGTSKYISVTNITVSGADAEDHTANTTAAAFASITPLTLTVNATGVNKVYDATTAATVILTDDPLAGDDLILGYASAAFNNKNVGNNKAVSVSGISATGADADDYAINTVATTTADITPAVLTVSATGENKVYNATTTASVGLVDNALGGDELSLAYASASFATKNVGNGETVTVGGITIGGTDAGNYTFNKTATTIANITPATLTVDAVGSSKPYDGTTAATVSLTDNAYAGDQISLTHGPASFANAAVGNDKTITVAGIVIGGSAEGDYVLATNTATTTGDIVLDTAYTEAEGTEGSWALTPALPPQLTPSDPSPPASILDLTMPGSSVSDGAGPDIGPGSAGAGAAGTGSNGSAGAGAGTNGTGTGNGGISGTAGTGSNGSSGTGAAGTGGDGSTGSASAGTNSAGAGSAGISGIAGTGSNGSAGAESGASGAGSDGSAGAGSNGSAGITGVATTGAGTGSADGTATASGTAAGVSGGTLALADQNNTASGNGGVNDLSSTNSNALVTVSMVRPATAQQPGMVTVSVPEEIVWSGKGFGFALPTSLVGAATAGDVQVTLMNGGPLPSWLRYLPGSKTFTATSVPKGGLPIQVLVRIGAKNWTVLISKR